MTTGNFYFGPEVLFPAATPRPLIGRADERRDWDDRDFAVNQLRSELETADHLSLPIRPPVPPLLCLPCLGGLHPAFLPPDLCDQLLDEALHVPRLQWTAIFNDEWPVDGAIPSGVRRMVTTPYASPGANDCDLPRLRQWAADYVVPALPSKGAPVGFLPDRPVLPWDARVPPVQLPRLRGRG